MGILISFFSARSKTFFRMFSLTHIFTLIFIVLVILMFLLFIKNKDERIKKHFRIILGSFAIFIQISYMFWLILNNNFTIKESLPINICSVSLILVFFLFVTENKYLFNLLYFWGLIGSLYALFFPNILQNFPHFRFLEFFSAHGLIILSVFYFLFIKKYIVSFKDMIISYLITIGYLFFVFIINLILKSNYLYLMKKPHFNSFFDIFGNFYYLGLMTGVLFLYILLYIPFYVRTKIRSKTTIEENY